MSGIDLVIDAGKGTAVIPNPAASFWRMAVRDLHFLRKLRLGWKVFV
jgi:hypothetical protein